MLLPLPPLSLPLLPAEGWLWVRCWSLPPEVSPLLPPPPPPHSTGVPPTGAAEGDGEEWGRAGECRDGVGWDGVG